MHIRPSVFMTAPTADLTYLLGKDTIKLENVPFTKRDLRRLMEHTQAVSYREQFTTSNFVAELYDAGHIPGSSSIYLEGEKRLFYTADVNTIDTRLLNKADQDYPDVDVLIVESTYYGKNHPSRSDLERDFIESIVETLDGGGNVIIPCFAVGRTQEIVMILHAHGLSPYVDGMGLDALGIMEQHPSFVRDEEALVRAFADASAVDPRKRSDAIEESSIVVTTAGMLNGGPALHYINELHEDPESKIVLTGYQVEGTNGRKALENGYIEANGRKLNLKMKVEQYDFSAHADDNGLKAIVSEFRERGVETIFTVHGEDVGGFAAWISDNLGCNSISPRNGEEFIL